MRRYAFASVRMALITLLLLGAVYPMAMTGAAQVLFPSQANGSLVHGPDGRTLGSSLIGQRFIGDGYFHGRPSAAGIGGYDPGASGASNLGPTSRVLIERVQADVTSALKREGHDMGVVPVDMVTASGSGLDPDITIANAEAQARRVAKARGMGVEQVRRMIRESTIDRQFGVLGERRVNVLLLNRALDHATGR